MTTFLAGLRVEVGLDLAFEDPSEVTVELSRLLSGFLAAGARFVAVGKDDAGAVDFVVAVLVLVAAGTAGTTEAALLRAEARVVMPVMSICM